MLSRAALLGAKRVTFCWEERKAVVLETWPRRLKRVEREGWSWIDVARFGAWAEAWAERRVGRRRVEERMVEMVLELVLVVLVVRFRSLVQMVERSTCAFRGLEVEIEAVAVADTVAAADDNTSLSHARAALLYTPTSHRFIHEASLHRVLSHNGMIPSGLFSPCIVERMARNRTPNLADPYICLSPRHSLTTY